MRGIEVMLQAHEEKGEESDAELLTQRIYKVLYAKHDDEIFVTDEGELVDNNNPIEEQGGDGFNDSAITMDDLGIDDLPEDDLLADGLLVDGLAVE